MIEGTGYLKFVKSRDHLYVYLHGRLEGEKLKKHLFPFGRLEAALENMYSIRDSNVLPEELVSMNRFWNEWKLLQKFVKTNWTKHNAIKFI